MDNMLVKEEIDAIVNGNHSNVFAVLGIHRDKGSKKVFIRVYNPFANDIEIVDNGRKSLGKMTAPAKTSPSKHPRPASSQPTINCIFLL